MDYPLWQLFCPAALALKMPFDNLACIWTGRVTLQENEKQVLGK
jgi:hypothetical protein